MLSEADIFSGIVHVITDDDLTLLEYLVIIKKLAKEGQDRLSEAENKAASLTHWSPKGRHGLIKQLKEARDKNAPEGSIWRKIYILGGLKVVIILGLIANGRNLGNRSSKSRMKRSKETADVDVKEAAEIADKGREEKSKMIRSEETADVAVEEAAENADNGREEKSNSKPTLLETINRWPLHVLKGLVEEILKIKLTQKVGLWHNAQPDSGELNSGEPDIRQGLSKKRKRGDDEGEDQLTGVTELTRRLLGAINSIKKRNIQSSQTPQIRSVSVPSLLNREGTLKNANFTVGKFRNIIPKWNDRTTLYVNPLGLGRLGSAGPRRIDMLGNVGAQVNVTGYEGQPQDLKDMSPSRFYETILSHLDDKIGLSIACINGSGVMQILIPGSSCILNLQMESATKLWQLLKEKD